MPEICKDCKGNEDQYIKQQVISASKIVFTKHNACWLIHAPDYKPVATEVLLASEQESNDIDSYIATDIDESTITAYCLEIIEKSVYEFEKRITRSMASGKPKSKRHTTKKTTVLYRDLPTIPSIESWRGIQLLNQSIPTAMQKYIVSNDKSLPQGIIAIKTSDKGTPKIIVPKRYQKPLVTNLSTSCNWMAKNFVRINHFWLWWNYFFFVSCLWISGLLYSKI